MTSFHFRLLNALILLATPLLFQAQASHLEIAIQHLQRKEAQWRLTASDLSDLYVTDHYVSQHNGTTHLYFNQRYNGIPIFNAISGVHLDIDNKVVYATNRFWPNLAKRIQSTQPQIGAHSAIQKTAEHLGIKYGKKTIQPRSAAQNTFLLEDRELSRSPIPVALTYLPMPDSTLALAWQVGIHDPRNPDYWVMFIDAANGNVLNTLNRTISCQFDQESPQHSADCVQSNTPSFPVEALQNPVQDQAVYHVFPFPLESPIHGDRKIIIDPADSIASPFGWHDVNGIQGAEYTTTHGNNTFAHLDRDGDDASDGGEPDAGPELIFDFPFAPELEPEYQTAAALTQLFYTTNALHDFTYHYGFDEAAGNFQTNNYGKGGKERDGVLAQAHDGSGVNNANFLTLPDGDPGIMQMYFWTQSNAAYMRVINPEAIAGPRYVGTASFGLLITSKPTTGQIVQIIDSTGTNLGCSSIQNKTALRGKIALITRGTCTFKAKVLQAQKAGAIGVIIANTQDQVINMGDDNTSTNPIIPAVLLKASDAEQIQRLLQQGQLVEAALAYQGQGPALTDGSFDNGVVAHEYAHGISNRLTGGPSSTDCVFNDEAMGEGWSDFFTLITTVHPGQTGKEARGIGNYSIRNTPEGPGIRRKPYSTDFSINDQVYNDIIGTRPANSTSRAPHPVGEIWAATLWDLYWAMSNRYGWDADLHHGNGGNNMAIQLVMDGMKLQPCSPGFVDGRNAILLADQINNKGVNQCLIWEVFARRGLGWSADQGNINDRNDGIQAFDMPPSCTNGLYLQKKSTPIIQAGQLITIELEITNFKDTLLTKVQIQDMIPLGAQLVHSSIMGAQHAALSHDTLLLDIGDLEPDTHKTITYTLQSSQTNLSYRRFFDDLENGSALWETQAISGADGWELTTASARSGRLCWVIPASPRPNHQILQLKQPLQIEGKQPVLRFFHKFHTQTTYDGGVVELSFDQGATWSAVPDSLIFRKPYVRPLYNPIFGVAKQKGFSGQSEVTFQPSYIDLRPFLGKTALLRFRFATNEDLPGQTEGNLPGWFIDNIEFLDIYSYNTTALATAHEGDTASAANLAWGTLVEPGITTATAALPLSSYAFNIFPNPATETIYIQRPDISAENSTLELFSADGHTVKSRIEIPAQTNTYALPIGDLTPGFYFLHVQNSKKYQIQKVIIIK